MPAATVTMKGAPATGRPRQARHPSGVEICGVGCNYRQSSRSAGSIGEHPERPMRMLLSAAIPAFFLVLTNSALAQPEPSFPNASETVPELIELWEQSNSTCRG